MQVAGGVLDVDLGTIGRPPRGQIMTDRTGKKHAK